MPSPYAHSQRFKIVLQHFHREFLVATVVVDPHQRAIAVAAGLIAHSEFRNKGFSESLWSPSQGPANSIEDEVAVGDRNQRGEQEKVEPKLH
jgi:hypothetical protein